MRIACVLVPDLVVWAFRHADPGLTGAPVAIGGVPPARGRIVALSAEARRAGLSVGMSLVEAQSLLPSARFLNPDDMLVEQERQALATLLGGFSPAVAVGPDGAFWLDTRGLDRHHATEEAFARRLRQAVAERGYPASVGFADSRIAARVAAQVAIQAAGAGYHIVPAGRDRAFLAPLPLALLSLPTRPSDPDLIGQARALGITTAGAWAALPADTVAARFGAGGLALQALARGEDPAPFLPTPAGEALAVRESLDQPVSDLDLFTFHLKQAVDRLSRRLAARGLAVIALGLRLELEDHGACERQERFVRPTLATRLWLDCLRLSLSRKPLPSAIVAFTLSAHETAPARAEQILLFARAHAAADPQVIEEALARVRALVGPQGAVSPRAGDSHRPEDRLSWDPWPGLAPPRPGPPPRGRPRAEPPPGPAFPVVPVRLLKEPLKAEVRTAGGQPTFLETETVRGRILAVTGPHVLEGGWWEVPFARDYYVLALADGGRYWAFRDRAQGRWFLHGMFD